MGKLSLVEVAERLKKVEGEDDDQNDDSKWEPTYVEETDLPPFNELELGEGTNAEFNRIWQYRQILTFILHTRYIRKKDKCTIMPIPTTREINRLIFRPHYLEIGSKNSVSAGIDRMKDIGLIKIFVDTKSFGHRKKEDNYGYTYKYYYTNEVKFLEFCKQNGIEPIKILNQKNTEHKNYVKAVKKGTNYCTFDESEVRFQTRLRLTKPDNMTENEFFDYLTSCLYKNYKKLYFFQGLADFINYKFYDQKEKEQYWLSFKPTFKWGKDGEGNFISKIGIRASNALCNKKKEDREIYLKEHGFVLQKDIKSSIPRITRSLNDGKWYSEGRDIYKEIYESLGFDEDFNDEIREAIKSIHMRGYFDNTAGNFKYHTWDSMDQEGITRDDLDDSLDGFKEALIEAEGGKTYGNEAFYAESCIYIDILWKMIHDHGIDTWLLYDCFYGKGGRWSKTTQDAFEYFIEDFLERRFDYFYRIEGQYLKGVVKKSKGNKKK